MRVIGLTGKSGKRKFCDKRCHTSTKKYCTCICNGLLHGRGERFAKARAASASVYLNRTRGHLGALWLNPALVPD